VALALEDKKAIVAEVQNAAKDALSAVVADSRGVTVSKMDALRKQARESGVWLKVVRNTLAKRAFQGTAYECLSDSFVGPSIIAFSNDHPGAGARILREFAKSNDKLELKAACFEGVLVDIGVLATLPIHPLFRAAILFADPDLVNDFGNRRVLHQPAPPTESPCACADAHAS
jgi:large subunit ribosomal protein L10